MAKATRAMKASERKFFFAAFFNMFKLGQQGIYNITLFILAAKFFVHYLGLRIDLNSYDTLQQSSYYSNDNDTSEKSPDELNSESSGTALIVMLAVYIYSMLLSVQISNKAMKATFVRFYWCATFAMYSIFSIYVVHPYLVFSAMFNFFAGVLIYSAIIDIFIDKEKAIVKPKSEAIEMKNVAPKPNAVLNDLEAIQVVTDEKTSVTSKKSVVQKSKAQQAKVTVAAVATAPPLYKLYTDRDMMSAQEGIRNGMSCLEAAVKFNVPEGDLNGKMSTA